jgi:hypothetical protein
VIAASVLADPYSWDTLPGGVAGPLGLFIVILLGVATWLLIRNMNARLRRLPREFPPPVNEAERGGAERDERASGDDPESL